MLGFDRKFISAAEQQADPEVQNMQAAVASAKKQNPFVVYEATGNDLVYAIFDAAKNDTGIHLEKALAIAGALAGFACAMTAGLQNEAARTSSKALSHQKRLEHILLGSSASLMTVLTKKTQALNCAANYDVHACLQRCATATSSELKYQPKMPKGRHFDGQPLGLVLEHWQMMLPLLNRYDEHFNGWPISWAAACAQLMEMGHEAIPANEALQIIMEYAVPMSLVGPSAAVSKPQTEAA